MVQKSTKGRPRGFDAGIVLGQARDTFWRHGYDATSMDRIAAATGLHKPSLYGAFGDKKRLYLEALNTYLEEAREQFGAALRLPDLWESLDDLNRRAIAMFTRDGTAAGCFMMSTAIPVTADHEEIMAAVRGSMDELDRALAWRFKRAIEAGQIPADADVAGLTRVIVTGHYELSARARAGYGPEELAALAEATVRMARKLAE